MKNECPPVQMMLLIEELKLNEVPFNLEFAVIQMQLKQCQYYNRNIGQSISNYILKALSVS